MRLADLKSDEPVWRGCVRVLMWCRRQASRRRSTQLKGEGERESEVIAPAVLIALWAQKKSRT